MADATSWSSPAPAIIHFEWWAALVVIACVAITLTVMCLSQLGPQTDVNAICGSTALVYAFVALGVHSSVVARGSTNQGQHEAMGPMQRMVSSVILFPVSMFVWHIIAIIFGARVLDDASSTLAWSTLMTALTTWPTCLQLPRIWSFTEWQRVLLRGDCRTFGECLSFCGSVGAVVGTWISAVIYPLDWDRWYQEHPIPLVIGCTAGHTIGVVGAVFYATFSTMQSKKAV